MFIVTRPKSDPARWARVHLEGDRNLPFEMHEPDRPFWLPEWTIRRLLKSKAGSASRKAH